ncbi:hypothetical protein NLU13_5259 [Sarocladium strictum]|uniref:Dynamin N-terminal domain-containing protein n=1 Tax=Sarocladium strictum TaxID=5046 RepID=A0AA39GGW7_SARSR|nr:hypothetical protein NLU13_5259 [Sarocladium strictum]
MKRLPPPSPGRDEKKPRLEDASDGAEATARFPFQISSDLSDVEQLGCEDRALREGLQHVERILGKLRSALNGQLPPRVEQARTELEELASRSLKHEILVGVCGPTGAGKSSLINALFGIPNLLQKGQCGATTAVACKVAYNSDADPSRYFRAIIKFQDEDDVINELKDLLDGFQTIQTHDPSGRPQGSANDGSSGVHGENAIDISGVRSEVNVLKSKYKDVFGFTDSQLKQLVQGASPDELRGRAVTMLQSKPNVVALLKQQNTEFAAPVAEILAQQLAPYLGPGSLGMRNSESQGFPKWPLIRDAQILLRDDFLRTGIVLVDLPGLGDANAGRVAVTERYETELDIVLIVAPAQRAADDSVVAKLLTSNQQGRLRTGGLLSQHRLAIVATKSEAIDDDDHMISASDEIAYLREDMVGHEEETGRWNVLIQSLQGALRDIEHATDTLKEDQDARVRAIMGGPQRKSNAPVSLKAAKGRVRGEIKEADSVKANIARHLEVAQTRRCKADVARKVKKQQLFHLLSTSRKTIVELGLKKTAAELAGEDLNSGSTSEEEVSIFHTSSEAFWRTRLQNKTKTPLNGFPQDVFSGIPDLRRWIALNAARRSKEWMRSLLDDLFLNLTLLESGFSGSLCPAPIQPGQKTEDRLEKAHASLGKEDEREEFEERVGTTVRNWRLRYPDDPESSENMPYGTHWAILKRNGAAYKPPRDTIVYNWIQSFMGTIFEPLQATWSKRVNELVARAVVVCDDMHRHWKIYIESIISITPSTEHTKEEPSQHWHFHGFKYEERPCRARAGMTRAPYKTNQAIVRDFMAKNCKFCLEKQGKGCFAYRREWLEQNFQAHAGDLFLKVVELLHHSLKTQRQRALEQAHDLVKKSIGRVRSVLVDGNTEESDQPEADLGKETQAMCAAWAHDWQLPDMNKQYELKPVEPLPAKLEVEHLGRDHPAVRSHGKNFYDHALGKHMSEDTFLDSGADESVLAEQIADCIDAAKNIVERSQNHVRRFKQEPGVRGSK